MNTALTELVFILDRSGSMKGLERDTIDGFNGMIRKQKEETEQKKLLEEFESSTEIKQTPQMRQYKDNVEMMYGKNPYEK